MVKKKMKSVSKKNLVYLDQDQYRMAEAALLLEVVPVLNTPKRVAGCLKYSKCFFYFKIGKKSKDKKLQIVVSPFENG